MFTDGGRRWRCNVCLLLNEGGLQVNREVCRFGEEWTGGAEVLDVTSW
jgi:hypothetical protein